MTKLIVIAPNRPSQPTLRDTCRSWQFPTYFLANCPSVNFLRLLYLAPPTSRHWPVTTAGKAPLIFSIFPIGAPSLFNIMLTTCCSNGLISSIGGWERWEWGVPPDRALWELWYCNNVILWELKRHQYCMTTEYNIILWYYIKTVIMLIHF